MRLKGQAKAKEFDLVKELSLVAQSIEATLSEKDEIAAIVAELIANNSQCLLYWSKTRLLCSNGSFSQIKRNFLYSM